MPALKRVLSSYLSSSLQKFVPKIFLYRWVKYLSHCSNKSGNLYYYSYTPELQTRLFLFWLMSWLFLAYISICILYLLSNFILVLLLHIFTKVFKQGLKLLQDKYYICTFLFLLFGNKEFRIFWFKVYNSFPRKIPVFTSLLSMKSLYFKRVHAFIYL